MQAASKDFTRREAQVLAGMGLVTGRARTGTDNRTGDHIAPGCPGNPCPEQRAHTGAFPQGITTCEREAGKDKNSNFFTHNISPNCLPP
jgi:hypothetical protein